MNSNSTNIIQCLNNLYSIAPEKPILGDSNGWLTVEQVKIAASGIAGQLHAIGINSGDHIALHAERSVNTVLAILGIRMIGAVAILTDPHQTPERFIGECSVSVPFHGVMVLHSKDCFYLHKGHGTHSILINTTATADDNFQSATDCTECDGSAPGYFIFTSGTSGASKAVVQTDMSLINNLLDSNPLGGYSFDDIALGALPLEHIFGLVLMAGVFVLGYSLFFPSRTDVPSLLQAIDMEKITRMNGVPSLYMAMAELAPNYSLESLRVGFIGGAPTAEAQFIYMEETLGMTLVPVYGMSECIGISCADSNDPRTKRCSNVGRAYPRNRVRILLDNGKEAAPLQEGEIVVNGPARMWGYWPDRMDPNQMLYTGDLGYFDEEGYLIISGRKKEIIIRNGKNLSPKKIEDAILSLPNISAATVVGLPDERSGEAPYAMVVGIVDPSDLKKILPKNELPAGIMCVESLPLTSSGKPDKTKIREVLTKWRNG